MKYCETLLNYVNREISNIDIQSEKCLVKIGIDFNYAFEWSYCEDLYVLNYKKKMFTGLLNIINEETDSNNVVEYLLNIIKGTNANLKRGNFISRSTNAYSNIAHTLKLEEDVKFISTCKRFIEYLTDKEPMLLK